MRSHGHLALIPDPPVLAGLRAPPAVCRIDGATVLLLFSPDHCMSFLSPLLGVSGPHEGQELAICSNWIHTRNEPVKFQKRFLI